MVMLSPTMLVSLAGSSLSEPARTDGRRGVDDERVEEVAAGVAVARGKRQLRTGRGAADRVLAVQGDALRVGEHRRAAAEEGDLVGVGSERQTGGRQVDDQRVGRAVVRELAGQVDVLVERLARVAPQVDELDRVGVDRVGVDRAVEGDVDRPGRLVRARGPADGVEVDRRCPLGRRLGDAGDFGRVQVDVLIGTDVHERVAAEAGARWRAGLRGADETQNVALAGDRCVVVGAGDAVGAREAAGLVVRTGAHSSGKLKKPEPGKVTIWRGSVDEPKPPNATSRARLFGDGQSVAGRSGSR